MIDTEAILNEIRATLPNVEAEVVPNPSPSGQDSLLVAGKDLVAVAEWLKTQPQHCFDYLSNVTGIDRLDEIVKEKVKKTEVVDGEEVEKVETVEHTVPGYLEVVYHLYSVSHREGPLVLRVRTEDRGERVTVPSLTPLWRSAEFQEREVFDLFGIRFEGHPDLRRLLMWDDYEEHPMRKDFVDPDDYEYEPTPHGTVLERNRAHQEAKH